MCNWPVLFCFFKQKTAYEMRISDWSSDVCSSDLKIVILTPDPERFRGALTLAAAQAALGASVSIFLQLEAVALLRRPYGAPGDSAHKAKGLPTLAELRSEEHTSELQSLMRISYAVFCLKKKKN